VVLEVGQAPGFTVRQTPLVRNNNQFNWKHISNGHWDGRREFNPAPSLNHDERSWLNSIAKVAAALRAGAREEGFAYRTGGNWGSCGSIQLDLQRYLVWDVG